MLRPENVTEVRNLADAMNKAIQRWIYFQKQLINFKPSKQAITFNPSTHYADIFGDRDYCDDDRDS